jgi:hypothetical protein
MPNWQYSIEFPLALSLRACSLQLLDSEPWVQTHSAMVMGSVTGQDGNWVVLPKLHELNQVLCMLYRQPMNNLSQNELVLRSLVLFPLNCGQD